MNIRVAQYSYGNIEKESSPTRMGGFQTFGYSKRTLTADDVSELEGKMIYFASETTSPVKTLFFCLSSRKFVISRVIPQEDLDRFGRRGNYLAHSFVFTSKDFSLLKHDPFLAFRLLEDKFARTAADVMSIGTMGDIDLPEFDLNVPEQTMDFLESTLLIEAQRLSGDELIKLVHLALTAAKLKADRTSIAIIGSPPQVENILKEVFALVADELKVNCSFDTYAYGCNPVASYFWARGYPSSADAPRQFLIVDAVEQRVHTNLPSPNSAYERWLFNNISRGDLKSIAMDTSVALELGRFLQNETYSSQILQRASSNLVNDFFRENRSLVGIKIKTTLTEAFGVALWTRLVTWASTRYRFMEGSSLLSSLLRGFDLLEIEEHLFEIFKSEKPSPQEMEALEDLLKKSRHPSLSILISTWKQDYRRIQEELNLLPQDEYVQMARLLLHDHYVPVTNLLSERRPERLIREFVDLALNEPSLLQQVLDVTKALTSMRKWEVLEELVPLIKEMDTNRVKSLSRRIKNHESKAPRSFLEAIEECLSSVQNNPEEVRRPIKGLFLGFGKKKPK